MTKETKTAQQQAESKSEANGEESEKKESTATAGDSPPKIDFPTFILSLFTTGQFQLGEIPNPYTQKFEQNLMLAVETIDIIALLEEKTRGNLTEKEEKLIEDLLYSLRMSYLNKIKK